MTAAMKVKDDELKSEEKILFTQCGKDLQDQNEFRHLCDYFLCRRTSRIKYSL